MPKALLTGILTGILFLIPPSLPAAETDSISSPSPPAKLHELATDALVDWRRTTGKPTLLLLTNEPFLQPIPQHLATRARRLALEGSADDLIHWGRYFRSDPQLLPSQTTSAAIEAGLIRKIIWVVPLKKGQTPDSEKMTNTLVASGILSKSEGDNLKADTGGLKGTVRGVPLMITTLEHLPAVAEPCIVHLDLSFFQALYRNEISTPAYSLAWQTASTLRVKCWNLAQTTISLSTEEEGMVHVGFRFLGSAFKDAMSNPTGTFASDDRKRHSRILKLAALMQTDEALKELEALLKDHSDKAYLHYEHYRFLRGKGRGTEALSALEKAVDLDSGYGFEYLTLARPAVMKGRPDAALTMLEKASEIFPYNPFIELEMLSLLEKAGAAKHALRVAEKLLATSWSDTYHSQVRNHLEDAMTRLEKQIRTERK